MFEIGIYTGLRISDILKLKVGNVRKRKNISIRESKTGKQKIIPINAILKTELDAYIAGKPDDEYLIKSRETVNKPLTREMAYKILNEVGSKFGLESIGTHTLRKTFGYHYYMKTKDIVTLQKIFNHSTPETTLRYIGIQQETINKAIRDFRY